MSRPTVPSRARPSSKARQGSASAGACSIARSELAMPMPQPPRCWPAVSRPRAPPPSPRIVSSESSATRAGFGATRRAPRGGDGAVERPGLDRQPQRFGVAREEVEEAVVIVSSTISASLNARARRGEGLGRDAVDAAGQRVGVARGRVRGGRRRGSRANCWPSAAEQPLAVAGRVEDTPHVRGDVRAVVDLRDPQAHRRLQLTGQRAAMSTASTRSANGCAACGIWREAAHVARLVRRPPASPSGARATSPPTRVARLLRQAIE